MGQRLVVNIVKGKHIIANCYFHWSGYTETAIEITKQVIANVQGIPNIKNKTPLDIAIEAFKLYGYNTGLDKNEVDYIASEYPDVDVNSIPYNNDRNEGIISIKPDGIQDSLSAGEMIVDINIDNDTVLAEYLYPDDSDEYGEDVMECNELTFNPKEPFAFDDIDVVGGEILGDDGSVKGGAYLYEGKTYYSVA